MGGSSCKVQQLESLTLTSLGPTCLFHFYVHLLLPTRGAPPQADKEEAYFPLQNDICGRKDNRALSLPPHLHAGRKTNEDLGNQKSYSQPLP